MTHWLTAPILIPLIGGILQVFMGYAPISLRRTLALITTVLMMLSTIVLLVMCWSMYVAFHEELDLLESHYDVAVYRKRHSALLEHHGLAEPGASTQAGGSSGDGAPAEAAAPAGSSGSAETSGTGAQPDQEGRP